MPGAIAGPKSSSSRFEKMRPIVGEPFRPRHVDALVVVREVVEVQLEEVRRLHELAHLLAVDVGVAVRGEAHHLALVAVLREAQPLRDGRVEDAERVREEHAVEHVEVVAVAEREHRRGEVAEAVHRQDRGLLERRDEERARDVRLVVLDVVELRAQLALLDAERAASSSCRPPTFRMLRTRSST